MKNIFLYSISLGILASLTPSVRAYPYGNTNYGTYQGYQGYQNHLNQVQKTNNEIQRNYQNFLMQNQIDQNRHNIQRIETQNMYNNVNKIYNHNFGY